MKKLLIASALVMVGMNGAWAFEGSSAYKGYGTVPGGSLADSAATHATLGVVAGQVHAGKGLTPNNISNYAIGVQNVNSINGDGSSINSTQNGTSNGTVRNQGQISGGNGGDNVVGGN